MFADMHDGLTVEISIPPSEDVIYMGSEISGMGLRNR